MSKYNPLWEYVKMYNAPELTLKFSEIKRILGFAVDHSFITYKKELLDYGFVVDKVSMTNKVATFKRK